ncbi:uncharacterized protein TrAtP1_011445 [Trichoderma atroviride]|uniref:uncharacterized protein n=1 Tax=Hypocrea atroviridis TaxID=63577 RepID=UPI0033210A8C|nr:hypothetical protein TrAtP1_011445 [Trichoderma atroviride]
MQCDASCCKADRNCHRRGQINTSHLGNGTCTSTAKEKKRVLTSKAESAFDRNDGNNRTMYIDNRKGPTTSIACSNHSGLVLTLPRQLPKENYCLLGVRIL